MKNISKITIDKKFFLFSILYLTILICAIPIINNKFVVKETINETINTIQPVDVKKEIVFNKNDVTQISKLNKNELSEVLKGTIAEEDAIYLYNIENKYGINALFLASIFIYQGDATRLGDNQFSNDRECLEFTAKILRNNYINENGVYYKGKSIKDISYYLIGSNNNIYESIIEICNTLQQ